MEVKVEIKTIPEHGLFIYCKQVWRSMGKLILECNSITAQRVVLTEEGVELSCENADFIETLLVTPYLGEAPKMPKHDSRHGRSWYQYCIDKLK